MVDTFRPSTLEEAVALRARQRVAPFAGGTDLMVKLRRGAGALPGFTEPVLFLDRCPELRSLGVKDGALEIGSMVTLRTLAESSLVPPTLRDALLSMGGPGLRTVATLGGNICNASPAADTLPFLYAFDARVTLVSQAGERAIPIPDFITGPGKTRLRSDELLRSVLIPAWSPSRAMWRKVGTRKANALTKVSIAALADLSDARGPHARILRARIALGAVGPTVVRLTSVEALLEGADLEGAARLGESIRDATRAAVHPIDDQRSTVAYRQEVAAGLVESFVLHLAGA